MENVEFPFKKKSHIRLNGRSDWIQVISSTFLDGEITPLAPELNSQGSGCDNTSVIKVIFFFYCKSVLVTFAGA